jgi:CRISPR-associated endoribonuclease Cas6
MTLTQVSKKGEKAVIMVKQIKLFLESTTEKNPHYLWGYNLYGVLMQKLNPDYAELFHRDGQKPISQYLEVIKHKDKTATSVWTINLLGQEAIEEVLPILLKENSFIIENHDTKLKVVKCEEGKTLTENEFAQQHLITRRYSTKMRIVHITPCSFKTKEQYAIFPSAELIIKSAVQKWNFFSKGIEINDDEAIEQLFRSVRINNYFLRSTGYHLKGIVIPSFIGNTVLTIRGPEPMIRLFNMLISFLEYSGRFSIYWTFRITKQRKD